MDAVLSILTLSALLFSFLALFLWRSRGLRTQPLLLVFLAIIAIANVLIWTVPYEDGDHAPVQLEYLK